jgi:hypothetical protein
VLKSERLLQFIWQHKLFDLAAVTNTVQGDAFTLISAGRLNTNQGPDFVEGKLKIGSTTWVGDIELHVVASDWHKHKHSDDPNYNKVIAHVVYEADVLVLDKQNNSIPCIELKNAINEKLLGYYQDLMDAPTHIPCASMLQNLPSIIIEQQLDRVLAERLISKAAMVEDLLVETNSDWSEVLYIMLAKALGGNINANSMIALASRVPLRVLAKHSHQYQQVESILFGVSGLLPLSRSADPYVLQLQQDFDFLRVKLGLQVMDVTRWKFSRMRPPNFPTMRIAQLAALICSCSKLWSMILENTEDIVALRRLLQCSVSEYWCTHYTMDANTSQHPRKPLLSEALMNQLLINAIAPCMYIYGYRTGESAFCEAAIQLLRALPMERNTITDLLTDVLPVDHRSAAVGQAYIHQYATYCQPKRCLSCSIGFAILKPAAK